jgi:hypothetical protein
VRKCMELFALGGGQESKYHQEAEVGATEGRSSLRTGCFTMAGRVVCYGLHGRIGRVRGYDSL